MNTTRVSKEFRAESSEIGSKQNVIFTNSSFFLTEIKQENCKKKKNDSENLWMQLQYYGKNLW